MITKHAYLSQEICFVIERFLLPIPDVWQCGRQCACGFTEAPIISRLVSEQNAMKITAPFRAVSRSPSPSGEGAGGKRQLRSISPAPI